MVAGMRLAQVQPLAIVETAPAVKPRSLHHPRPPALQVARENQPVRAQAAATKAQPAAPPAPRPDQAPWLPATVLTDALVFLTFVYIYTTNATGSQNAFDILFGSIFQRPANGQYVNSPAIFFLLFFTWLVAATIGLAAESMSHRAGARRRLVGARVWPARGGGLGQLAGLRRDPGSAPGAHGGAGRGDQPAVSQPAAGKRRRALWLLYLCRRAVDPRRGYRLCVAVAARAGRACRPARRHWRQLTGVAAASLAIFLVYTVNINLVKADIVYKQGQQFDSQGNWVNSVELYRRALATRKTEDHYMLFLGRALLEQAKQAPVQGVVPFAAPIPPWTMCWR